MEDIWEGLPKVFLPRERGDEKNAHFRKGVGKSFEINPVIF